jgi:hypothetical protein
MIHQGITMPHAAELANPPMRSGSRSPCRRVRLTDRQYLRMSRPREFAAMWVDTAESVRLTGIAANVHTMPMGSTRPCSGCARAPARCCTSATAGASPTARGGPCSCVDGSVGLPRQSNVDLRGA